MLILGDDGHYHGRFPWVTASLVVVNVLVFVAQVCIGDTFTNGFSLVPEEITTFTDIQGTKYHKVKLPVPGHIGHDGKYRPQFETKSFPIKHYTGPFPIFLTLFTSIFMHGDVFHLIGNMWFLLVFGRNVECAMSHGRFLAFYTACGVCAGLAHWMSDIHSIIPCLGASGAISGIMGAYISIHPFNNIKCWFGWWIGVIEIPALVVIGAWFLLQYIAAFVGLEDEMLHDGVAYWAHLGGFAAGFIILRGVVFYLHRKHEEGALDSDEPLIEAEKPKDELANAMPPAPVTSPLEEETAVAAGKPDPFASFLSVQTLRKMQEEQNATKTS
jgi:membrane associated rhomboid family serine protease